MNKEEIKVAAYYLYKGIIQEKISNNSEENKIRKLERTLVIIDELIEEEKRTLPSKGIEKNTKNR